MRATPPRSRRYRSPTGIAAPQNVADVCPIRLHVRRSCGWEQAARQKRAAVQTHGGPLKVVSIGPSGYSATGFCEMAMTENRNVRMTGSL